MIAALLLSASIAATPPPAPAALGGMQLGESIVDVLKSLGAPDNVVTRDDGIFWQWARADGIDREVLTGEDLIIKQVLIASLPPANATSNAVPLQGTVTPPGGVSVIVIPTGTLPGNELEVSGGVEDWLPHPVINTTTATVERNNAALSILAS